MAVGDSVLVETEYGLGLARVVSTHGLLPDDIPVESVRDIVRKAGDEDLIIAEENRHLADIAYRFCNGRIQERGLDMKLVHVGCLFDRSKLIFYFTAPTRIDFRELVKDLVREYHMRIELRQIGVRHETQMLGTMGNCGMVCCCHRFLHKFVPVTIKMAKEQNLFLNPSKISGSCGRLLCCLSYEQENYDFFHNSCPKIGKRYQTDKGSMKVLRTNMFRNSIALLTEANEEIELVLEEWQALNPCRTEAPKQENRQEKGIQHPYGDDLLVVTVGPESLEDGDIDALSPFDEGIVSSNEDDRLKHKHNRRRKR